MKIKKSELRELVREQYEDLIKESCHECDMSEDLGMMSNQSEKQGAINKHQEEAKKWAKVANKYRVSGDIDNYKKALKFYRQHQNMADMAYDKHSVSTDLKQTGSAVKGEFDMVEWMKTNEISDIPEPKRQVVRKKLVHKPYEPKSQEESEKTDETDY